MNHNRPAPATAPANRGAIDTWTRVEREVRSVKMRILLTDLCALRAMTPREFSLDAGESPDGFIPDEMAQAAWARNCWGSSIRALVKRGFLVPAEWNGKPGYQMTAPSLLNPYRHKRRPMPAHTRKAVFERDAHRCRACGATDRLALDHVFPYSRGGSDEIDNLQVLCRSCNSRKGARV